MEVAVACYGPEGTLLLGEAAAQQEQASNLVGLARDLTKAPVGTATGTYAGGPGLRETVTQLSSPVPGTHAEQAGRLHGVRTRGLPRNDVH